MGDDARLVALIVGGSLGAFIIFSLFLVLFWTATAENGDGGTIQKKPKILSMSYEQFVRKFGPDGSLSAMEKENRWPQYKGECIKWTGKVVSVDKISVKKTSGYYVRMKHLESTMTDDVRIYVPPAQSDIVKSKEEGSRFTYIARLQNYPGAVQSTRVRAGC